MHQRLGELTEAEEAIKESLKFILKEVEEHEVKEKYKVYAIHLQHWKCEET